MEITIVEEKENPFLNRKEIKLRMRHAGEPTPSKASLVKEFASRYSVEDSQIIIDYVFSIKGIGESFVKLKVLSEKPKGGEKVEAQASQAV